MQTARGSVRRVTEFRAGMQFGQHHFHTGKFGFRLDVNRDTAAVIGHFHGTVAVQRHNDMIADSRKSLIDGIIDDLPQAVHQTLAIGGADIHARALTHRVKTFKHGKTTCAVIVLVFRHFPHSDLQFCFGFHP